MSPFIHSVIHITEIALSVVGWLIVALSLWYGYTFSIGHDTTEYFSLHCNGLKNAVDEFRRHQINRQVSKLFRKYDREKREAEAARLDQLWRTKDHTD